MAKETRKIPIEIFASEPIILTARPQYPIVNLKVVPWNYGKGSEETSECKVILPWNNPLCLLKQVIETVKRPVKKVSEEKAVYFLKKIEHNEVKIIRRLEEAPTQVSILDLILTSEDHQQVLIKV